MNDAQILKTFKLQTSLSTANLVLFTSRGKIYRYASEIDILKEFYTQRSDLYELRKEFMLAQLQKDYEILYNKVRFIQAVIAGTIKINK
jgi:DNA topoisomerase-2